MAGEPFWAECDRFAVALAKNGVVIPGAGNGPLKGSLWPGLELDLSALYRLRIESGGAVVCEMPVQVCWVAHEKEPEPFLGLVADDPEELAGALRVYEGKPVSLRLSPEPSSRPS